MELHPLPMALEWQVAPADWSIGPDGSLHVAAGPRTDLFADPGGTPAKGDAPRFVGPIEGDFLLSARVTAGLRATFDAGALVLDAANGWAVDGASAWLRIARIGAACALHASHDGARWELVRHFPFEAPDRVAAGFLAQSPTGEGCTATFDEIGF